MSNTIKIGRNRRPNARCLAAKAARFERDSRNLSRSLAQEVQEWHEQFAAWEGGEDHPHTRPVSAKATAETVEVLTLVNGHPTPYTLW